MMIVKKIFLDGRQEKPLKNYQIENDPRFLQRIAEARKDLREGRGVRLEDIED